MALQFLAIFFFSTFYLVLAYGFPWWLGSKESAYSARYLGSVSGLGRSPGEGDGNPLQYSHLENPQTEEPGGLQSMGLQRVEDNPTTDADND